MPTWYQIRVKGHLDATWSAWFDGLTITHDADGATTLQGPVVDQAALYGLISRARDLGLTLLAVSRVADGLDDAPAARRGR
jgi:hypothetical protein